MSNANAPRPSFCAFSKITLLPTPIRGVAAGVPRLNRQLNAVATKRVCGATNATGAGLKRAARLNGPAMQFLKTLFWVLIAVVVVLFASRNWSDVTLNLWGDIQADIKLPVLMLIVFLIGFLPTWLILRARIWALRRRADAMERNRVAALPFETVAEEEEAAA